MHLHRIANNPDPGSLEAANAAQRATKTQQAATVRKKLTSPATLVESDEYFESLLLLGSAHSGQQHRSQSADESAAEEDQSDKHHENMDAADQDEHRSYWA